MTPTAPPLSHAASITANPDVAACELGDGLALLDLERSTYFSMNPVAAAIWERIATPATIPELRQLVVDTFDTGDADVEADVQALLRQMQELHLIRVSDG